MMLEGLAEGLAGRGWEVGVLATRDGSGGGDGEVRGVRITRTGVVFSKRSVALRAAGYAVMIPALVLGALRMKRHDVVVTMTDPPMLAVAGPVVARFKGCRTIHWAQDLYPEVAEALGVLPVGGLVARGLRRVSTSALAGHDAVVAIGRCMAGRLAERGLEGSRIHVVPNWSPPLEAGGRSGNGFRMRHGLEGEFVVMYSGNMGMAHDFDGMLGAAAMLRGRRVVFLMVGGGPRRAEIEARAARAGLGNVRFLSPRPREELAESLSAADAHLVTMRGEVSGLVVPSKYYGVVAAGRPCIFAGPRECEVARAIVEEGTGVVVAPGDAAQLAGAVLDWMGDEAAHAGVCRRARVVAARDGAGSAVAEFDMVARLVAGGAG